MMKYFLTTSLAACLLMGCATTPGSPTDKISNAHLSKDARLYADFLIGSYADNIEDAQTRVDYYARALSGAPDDTGLRRRAVGSAVNAGDWPLALDLASEKLAADNPEPLSYAVLGAKAFADGKLDTAAGYFEESSDDQIIYALVTLMKGWTKAAQGDPEAARKAFNSFYSGGYFDLLGMLQTANLESSLGNTVESEKLFALVEKSKLSPIETVLSRTRALSVAGNLDVALSNLEGFEAENGPFENGPIPVYLKKLQAGDPIDQTLTPQQQTAHALTESAYGYFLRNRSPEGAELFLRFALLLDPSHDKATIWLGSVVQETGRPDEALELYKSIDDDSPYIVSAKLSQANVYFDREEDDVAIRLLEQTNAEHTSFTTRESLGRARLIRENYADALPIYDALVKSMSEEELRANVEPLYFRGICYEREKRGDEAVADFKRVLEIEPDNADALNYLGYTWVDRNENLTEAFEMIRKAVRLEPQSGAIVDSLGWAHYKLGQYEQARVQLEKAVSLSPSSATIIDHLGDVYWKLGRFREAGYQWKRALDFDPTDEERAAIDRKLVDGLTRVDVTP